MVSSSLAGHNDWSLTYKVLDTLMPRTRTFTHLFDLVLMRSLEYSITRYVISLFGHIFSYTTQQITIIHTQTLQQSDQIVLRVRAIWASIRLPG